MLNKLSRSVLSKVSQKPTLATMALAKQQARAFSSGPYNPLVYKTHIVPEELPT